ncbi:MAG: adenylyltransferase/cytidyltransferase family protein [Armatimonadetes bacterium]|nr:adenylyltransferase/cytidyltransferase family protein [Armatimonadota bacterium]
MRIVVTGAFDDTRSPGVRLLDRAAQLGDVTVALWSDWLAEEITGAAPRFPEAERRYFLEAMRQVSAVTVLEALPLMSVGDMPWAVAGGNLAVAASIERAGMEVLDVGDGGSEPFPPVAPSFEVRPGVRRAVVTGCFDWIHTGHVRFFEEAAAYGDLYVCLGNDANIESLKGPGHPLFPAEERAFMVGSVRHVHRAVVSRGMGWLDAEPEIEWIRPDAYVVNEDGDKPEKRAFCASKGIEYVVLKRLPKPGLPARQSTDLRGF